MTPEALAKVEAYFGPYTGQAEFKPALELIEHTKELRAFVLVVANFHAMPGPTPRRPPSIFRWSPEPWNCATRSNPLIDEITN